MDPNRKSYIDIARGLGIILVVLGHNRLCYQNHVLWGTIFSFHIPLFFFLSGMLFNPNYSFIDTAINRSRSLLKPYLATCVIMGTLLMVKEIFKHTYQFQDIIMGCIYSVGPLLRWPMTPLWFLTSLFCTWLVFFLIDRNVSAKSSILRWGLYLFLLVIGIYILICGSIWFRGNGLFCRQDNHDFVGMPWNIDILPITLFFFASGKEYAHIADMSRFRTNILFLISLSVFVLISILSSATLDLNLRRYDDAVISTVKACSGILAVITFSKIFEKPLAGTLGVVGKYALPIFIFHLYPEDKAFVFCEKIFGGHIAMTVIFSFLIGMIVPVAVWGAMIRCPMLKNWYLMKK